MFGESPLGGRGVDAGAIGASMHDKMHAEFRFVEVVDQDERRPPNWVDIEAQPVVKRFFG